MQFTTITSLNIIYKQTTESPRALLNVLKYGLLSTNPSVKLVYLLKTNTTEPLLATICTLQTTYWQHQQDRRTIDKLTNFTNIRQRYTCQLSRIMRESHPWIKDIDLTHRGQFLMPDSQIRTTCSNSIQFPRKYSNKWRLMSSLSPNCIRTC